MIQSVGKFFKQAMMNSSRRRKRMKTRILSWIVCIAMVFTLIPDISFVHGKIKVTEDNAGESAITEKTEDTTTYALSNGANMTVFHGEEVRFTDDKGNMVDYDSSLGRVKGSRSENGSSLKAYAYENKKGDSKQYLPTYLSEDAPILMEKEGHEVELSFTDKTLEEIDLKGEKVEIKKKNS